VHVPARFSVHLMNTGVAEISTRRLSTDGFSIKGVIGSIARIVTKMGKVQKKLNQQTWEKMMAEFPKYEMRTLKQIERFQQLSEGAYERGDQTEGLKWKRAAAQVEIDYQKALKLKEQLDEVGGPENYDKVAGNPYAVGARVMLLAKYMGFSIHWHCKSGKDRTGMMDIEMKYLLGSMARSYNRSGPVKMTIPPLALDRESEEDKKLRARIALRSGNMEIAQINTGEYGLKTTRRKENVARYGKYVAEILAGHSDRVSS